MTVFQQHKQQIIFSSIALFFIIIIGYLLLSQFSRRETLDDRSQAEYQTQAVTVNPTLITNYLENPGMGWQNIDYNDPYEIPETVYYRRGSFFSRGLPQYTWDEVNPTEGVYDWRQIDVDIAAAAAAGKQLSFRITTMRGQQFGGHQVPQWVLSKGARLFGSTGEPDYSNCTYQQEWAKFVQAMRQRYDGNPVIAYIDVSGYGNFNEWSHEPVQSEENDDPYNPVTLDGQARKHLTDIFLGTKGETRSVQCRTETNQTSNFPTISYSYPGFDDTQLIHPYGGMPATALYAFSQRQDVGFRYDCLGNPGTTESVMRKAGPVINQLWKQAPIIYEFCTQSNIQGLIPEADSLLKQSHGTMAHDNFPNKNNTSDLVSLRNVLTYAGYRYYMREATCQDVAAPGGAWNASMIWQNIGYAPNYPKMGQSFQLHVYLMDTTGATVLHDWTVPANTTTWLPADPLPGTAPDNLVPANVAIPGSIAPGTYTTKVAIIDTRTSQPINLSFTGRDATGKYPLCPLTISLNATVEPISTPTATPTPTPTFDPSATPTSTPSATPTATPTPDPSTAPTATPTTPPGSTPTATPTTVPSSLPLACVSITSNITNLSVGQSVTFTCGTLPGANRYEFRYRIINTNISGTIGTLSNTSNISQGLAITQAGTYQVQCRPCADAVCTPFEDWPQ